MRIVGIIVTIAMASALAYGFTSGAGFGAEGSQLLDLVWGRVTVIDLYLMLGVFAAWIWTRESNKFEALAWTVALALLGSLAAGIYLMRSGRRAHVK